MFDLHNTIYDEVNEYHHATNSAIKYIINHAKQRGVTIHPDKLFCSIARARDIIGDKHDDDIWRIVNTITPFSDSQDAIHHVKSIYFQSRVAHIKAYEGVYSTLQKLFQRGYSMYVISDGDMQEVSDALAWLNVDQFFKQAYATRKRTTAYKPSTNKVVQYPKTDGVMYKKPHPMIMGLLILDIAKSQGKVPLSLRLCDMFELGTRINIRKKLTDVTMEHELNSEQMVFTNRMIESGSSELIIKSTQFQDTLEYIRSQIIYIGNSACCDGMLAKSANVEFILMQYGNESYNHIKDSKTFYYTSGLSSDDMSHIYTHEKLRDIVKPSMTCKVGMHEMLNFIER